METEAGLAEIESGFSFLVEFSRDILGRIGGDSQNPMLSPLTNDTDQGQTSANTSQFTFEGSAPAHKEWTMQKNLDTESQIQSRDDEARDGQYSHQGRRDDVGKALDVNENDVRDQSGSGKDAGKSGQQAQVGNKR